MSFTDGFWRAKWTYYFSSFTWSIWLDSIHISHNKRSLCLIRPPCVASGLPQLILPVNHWGVFNFSGMFPFQILVKGLQYIYFVINPLKWNKCCVWLREIPRWGILSLCTWQGTKWKIDIRWLHKHLWSLIFQSPMALLFWILQMTDKFAYPLYKYILYTLRNFRAEWNSDVNREILSLTCTVSQHALEVISISRCCIWIEIRIYR